MPSAEHAATPAPHHLSNDAAEATSARHETGRLYRVQEVAVHLAVVKSAARNGLAPEHLEAARFEPSCEQRDVASLRRRGLFGSADHKCWPELVAKCAAPPGEREGLGRGCRRWREGSITFVEN